MSSWEWYNLPHCHIICTPEFIISARFFWTEILRVLAPKLPPITNIVGYSGSKPKKEDASALDFKLAENSFRIGFPVNTTLEFGKNRSIPS